MEDKEERPPVVPVCTEEAPVSVQDLWEASEAVVDARAPLRAAAVRTGAEVAVARTGAEAVA